MNQQWQITEKGLYQQFKFSTFVEAFGFMTKVALLCEKAGHHPDWDNSYNKVNIYLITHEAGHVTEKDWSLAQAIDALGYTS